MKPENDILEKYGQSNDLAKLQDKTSHQYILPNAKKTVFLFFFNVHRAKILSITPAIMFC